MADSGLTEDRYIKAVEAKPSPAARRVVHHAVESLVRTQRPQENDHRAAMMSHRSRSAKASRSMAARVTMTNGARGFSRACVLTLVSVLAPLSFHAQIRYAAGQNVVPVFEGWERNADGSFNMVFGYMNRNYEEHVDIAVGFNNSLEPGGVDQNQPTHFYPRRQQFVSR
jgi:hypothetical protein